MSMATFHKAGPKISGSTRNSRVASGAADGPNAEDHQHQWMNVADGQHIDGAIEVDRLAAHDGLHQFAGALEHHLLDEVQRHTLRERRHQFPTDAVGNLGPEALEA